MAREFQNLEIVIDAKIGEALSSLAQLAVQLHRLDNLEDQVSPLTIEANISPALRNIETLERRLDALETRETTVRARGEGVEDHQERIRELMMALVRMAHARNNILGDIRRNTRLLLTQGIGGAARGPSSIQAGRMADPDAVADSMLRAVMRTHMGGDPMRRGRPGEIFSRQSVFNIKMRDINNALAKFLPLMVALKSGLPAVIVGLAGVAVAAAAAAGALASIAALGFVGVAAERAGGRPDMEAMQDILSDIRDDLLDAFMPLAQRMAPLMERALDGLAMLFQDVANAMDGLLDMRGDAQDFGRWVRRVLPQFVASLIAFSQSMMPIFRTLGNFLEQTSLINALTSATERVLPRLADLTNLLMSAAPVIFLVSSAMLDTAIIFAHFAAILAQIMDAIPFAEEGLGQLLVAFLTFASVMAITNALINFRLIPAMLQWHDSIMSGIVWIKKRIAGEVMLNKTYFLGTKAVWLKVAAMLTLITVLSLGLGAVLAFVGGIMSTAAASQQAADGLKNFNDELDRTTRQSAFRGPDDAPHAGTAQQRREGATSGGDTYYEINAMHTDWGADDADESKFVEGHMTGW